MILSIIIPTKNEEKYLPILLESIRKQTFKDYEVIIADNKSQDGTREIAKKYNCRVVDGGLPGKARNEGAKAATGEILLFLDADTNLNSENFLQNLLSEFGQRKLDAGVPMAFVNGTQLDRFYYVFWNSLVKTCQGITPFAGGWCIFARRQLHFKINGFDEGITLGEDSDYAKRAAKIGKFRVLKNDRIEVSPRRFKKEGHLKVAVQTIGTGIYWALKGKAERKNRFGYKFDIYDDKK